MQVVEIFTIHWQRQIMGVGYIAEKTEVNKIETAWYILTMLQQDSNIGELYIEEHGTREKTSSDDSVYNEDNTYTSEEWLKNNDFPPELEYLP